MGPLRGRELEGDTSKANMGPGRCCLTGRKSDSYTTESGSKPKFCAKLPDRLKGFGEYVVLGSGETLLGGDVWLCCCTCKGACPGRGGNEGAVMTSGWWCG